MHFFLKNKYLSLGILLLIVGGSFLWISQVLKDKEKALQPVTHITEALTFEIADTPEKRDRGLSGRAVIPDNYGMLFVFPEKDLHAFWMRDMETSIDMIWLSDEGKIVGIENRVTPESYPKTFTPPEPVRYVLETRAWYARDKGWTIGTKIDLPQI